MRDEAKKHDEVKKWHRKLLDKNRTAESSITHTLLSYVNEKKRPYLFENVYQVCEKSRHFEEISELWQSARWIWSVLQNGTSWFLELALKYVTEDMTDHAGAEERGLRKTIRGWMKSVSLGLKDRESSAFLCIVLEWERELLVFPSVRTACGRIEKLSRSETVLGRCGEVSAETLVQDHTGVF